MAVRAMGALGNHANVPALITVLSNEEEPEEAVRTAAVDALLVLRAQLTAAHLASLLERLQVSEEPAVRGACVKGTPSAVLSFA